MAHSRTHQHRRLRPPAVSLAHQRSGVGNPSRWAAGADCGAPGGIGRVGAPAPPVSVGPWIRDEWPWGGALLRDHHESWGGCSGANGGAVVKRLLLWIAVPLMLLGAGVVLVISSGAV